MSPHKQSNAGFPDFPFRLLGGSPEWIAGMRLHPGSVAATVSALTLYAGFPALVAAAVGCGAFYRSCEPLQLVLLPEQGAARFLARKVLAAWRNYFLFAVPYAAVIVLRHPDTCWMAAGWASLAALALLYAVVSKYARYQPDRTPRRPLAAKLGAAGFLIPLLLPLSLCLVVSYALRAERNLNHYLHDYD